MSTTGMFMLCPCVIDRGIVRGSRGAIQFPRGSLQKQLRYICDPHACESPFQSRSSVSEMLAKHWQAALGFSFCRLVLNYIPVLDEHAAGDPANVCGNPGAWRSEARKTAMDDHIIAARGYGAGLIPQCRR